MNLSRLTPADYSALLLSAMLAAWISHYTGRPFSLAALVSLASAICGRIFGFRFLVTRVLACCAASILIFITIVCAGYPFFIALSFNIPICYCIGASAVAIYNMHESYRRLRRSARETEQKVSADDQDQDEANPSEDRKIFVRLLVKILVRVAMSDGHFSKAELDVMLYFFKNSLDYDADELEAVKRLIKEAREDPTSLTTLIAQFGGTFAYTSCLLLLELIYALVHTKKPPQPAELEQAEAIARALKISSADLRNIRAKYMSAEDDFEAHYQYQRKRRADQAHTGASSASDAREAESSFEEKRYYATLGLEPGAGFGTIKKAYRKLSLQYHPDKVGHLGETFRRIAEEKMKELNVAYEYFEKKFKH